MDQTDGNTKYYDLSKDFRDLQHVSDEAELLILFNSDMVKTAKQTEIDNWIGNEVYSEVENTGQPAISSRWVITEKIKNGKSIVKARLVARGFEEDSSNLDKHSPTCSKESLKLTLAIGSANGWMCHSLDVKAAYLQGNPLERPVFLKPPPEYDCGYLWKLKKTVYGLCDAARSWYHRVRDQLLLLGLKMSTFDNAIFFCVKHQQLQGIICVYVDDFLYCGTEWFCSSIISEVCNAFHIGSSQSGSFKYLGLNLHSQRGMTTYIDQIQYSSSIQPMKLSRSRLNNKNSEMNNNEKSEFRALVGQLNWLAVQTRPDIAFDVCELSGLITKATVFSAASLNKVISRVTTDPIKIAIPKMNRIEDCCIEGFSDSSFANLANGGSQGGFIIFLKDSDGNRAPIVWQSRKIRRVVKSTLAAETLALLECAEAAFYVSKMISEIMNVPQMKINCKVDNHSLVEALRSSKLVEDRRLRIDIAVLKDMISKGELSSVSWVDTISQLADCLTKKGVPTERLLKAII